MKNKYPHHMHPNKMRGHLVSGHQTAGHAALLHEALNLAEPMESEREEAPASMQHPSTENAPKK